MQKPYKQIKTEKPELKSKSLFVDTTHSLETFPTLQKPSHHLGATLAKPPERSGSYAWRT